MRPGEARGGMANSANVPPANNASPHGNQRSSPRRQAGRASASWASTSVRRSCPRRFSKRNRPTTHEAYYLSYGSFYLVGHYYASLVISRLPEADQEKYWHKLRHEVMKTQQKDGSMWDFEMHNYSKPYGIAFGLLSLKQSIAGAAPAE